MEGIYFKRMVGTIFDKMSVIGGFITAVYYSTFYAYLFLTSPDTTLKLAQFFDAVTQYN